MSDTAHRSTGLAAKLDHLIESVTPTLRAASIAAVPVAASGHLGTGATLGLVAADRGLEVVHGVIHPMANEHEAAMATTVATTTENTPSQAPTVAASNDVTTANAVTVDSGINAQATTQTVETTTALNNEMGF